VIALTDVLVRCNWAKRILFLADRVALVNQAVNAFNKHLPDSSPVNLVTEKHTEGRVFVSTYPTMMGLIDEAFDGQRRFGAGHFDLIIIDDWRRPAGQDHHLCQEQRPCRLHCRALQYQLPTLQREFREDDNLQDRVCTEPD